MTLATFLYASSRESMQFRATFRPSRCLPDSCDWRFREAEAHASVRTLVTKRAPDAGEDEVRDGSCSTLDNHPVHFAFPSGSPVPD